MTRFEAMTGKAVLAALAVVMSIASSVADDSTTDQHAEKLVLQYTQAEHLLDGTSFEYFYEAGGGLKIAFADGMLQYEWISGPRKGNHAENIPYQSRLIGDEIYLVNWHQPDKPDFVSLVDDLGLKRLYSSAILRYGSGNEMIHFKEAEIKHIERKEP